MELKLSRTRLLMILLASGLIVAALLWLMRYRRSKAGSDAQKLFAGAEAASRSFHRQVAERDYDSILQNATPLFRKKNSPEHLSQYFKRAYDSYGYCEAGSAIAGRTKNEGSVTAVSLVYDERCAGGTIRETLTWQVDGNSYSLGNILMTARAE